METLKAIQNRFSAKSFIKKSIKHDDLANILQAAHRAPNAGNLQSYAFVLVYQFVLKKRLAKAAHNQAWIAQAPVIVVICSDEMEMGQHYGNKASFYGIQNCSAAAENVIIAATDNNIQSCWIGAFNQEEVSMALKLPRIIKPYIMIPLGYSTEEKRENRLPLKQFLHFNEFGTQDVAEGKFPR